MEISDIKIRKTMHEGRLRALVCDHHRQRYSSP